MKLNNIVTGSIEVSRNTKKKKKTYPQLFRFPISLHSGQFLLPSLTALPVRVAELQVPAGASRILLGSLGAADVLDLVVERLERGIDLGVVLPQVSGGLVGPHVPERVGTLLGLTQSGKGGHVNARTRGSRRTGWSRVSRGALTGREERCESSIW